MNFPTTELIITRGYNNLINPVLDTTT